MMSPQDKLKLFVQVRYDIKMATAWADEAAHSGAMTAEQAFELNRRCQKVAASALAFERAMQGIEPPNKGD